MLTSTAFAHFRLGTLCLALVLLLGASPMLLQAGAPPAAPPLTVDATQPNLFYGATPPNGSAGPVVVLVHGLSANYEDWIESKNCPTTVPTCSGKNNSMYDSLYQAGFRVALMSLSLDNSNNNASIQTNAAVLETVFPKILANFNVSQVHFVAHSKGGLDLQDALVNPQWLGIAKEVILLATPNQGDALADWCFSPAGTICGAGYLNLNGPGLQALEIANVLQLRSQWDPIFINAQVPFYTLSGDTFQCTKSSGSCSTALTGPILQSITGGAPPKGHAPVNDGLVTHPESLLPTTYAMELGVVHTNHYGMALGIYSFPFILGRVMQLENDQPGFAKIATGGFGNQHNTWAWTMAWFKGQLYVGTGREVYCVTSATSAVQLGIPGLYPPAIGDCTPDYHNLPLQAEIWQYTPSTNAWVRVFQSPNSLSTTDNKGNPVATARDIGFRSLSLVTEPGNVQALYAGGVTSGEMFQTASTGSWAPPRIIRSVDGVNWAPLPQDPGTFLGDLTLNGTSQYPNFSIRSGQQLNGILFLQVGDYPGVGRVIASIPGTNPAGGNNNFGWASPPTATLPVWILENFNNFVYAGTGTPPGAPAQTYGIFKTNGTGPPPYNWTPVITNGAYAVGLVADYAMSLAIFTTPDCPGIGCLYAGTDRPNELVRIHPDDSWDVVIGNPRTIPPGQPGAGQLKAPLSGIGQYFENAFTGHFWRMGVGGQGLYMGTWDWSSDNAYQPTFAPLWSQEFGTDVWRTNDGTHWTSVSKIGLGDGNNTGSRSFASTPYGLYMGTARSIGGAQIFLLDNSSLDYNRDKVIDQLDVNLLTARLGSKAQPHDPMDLNEDGMITSADVQLLRTQCTYPGCQVPAKRASNTTLASPVLYSAPGQLGGQVSLSWSTVPGAFSYQVYRIALSSSETTPPPGVNPCVPVTPSCTGANPTAGLGPANGSPANNGMLANACRSNPAARNLRTCYPYTQPNAGGPPQYGYPGPPQLLTTTSSTAYSEAALSALQQLYYVVALDGNGNRSTPSNIVGGPSLASK